MNANQLIETLGGPTAVARLFNIKAPSVSGWKKKNEIPSARMQTLRLLRPDLFRKNREPTNH